MLNILKEILRQTVRDKLLIGGGIYILAMIALTMFGDESARHATGSMAVGGAANFLPVMLPIAAGWITGRACGTDLRDKTANYEVLFGKKRSDVYFGRFFAALIITFALTALLPLAVIGGMTLVNGWGGSITVGNAMLHFGMLFPMVFRIVCFFTALTFFAGNDLIPLVVSVVGSMVLILSYLLMSEAGFPLTWHTAATDMLTLLDFSNTTGGFLNGEDITVYKVVLSGDTALRMLCTSVSIGLLWLFGGYAVFRRRDIS